MKIVKISAFRILAYYIANNLKLKLFGPTETHEKNYTRFIIKMHLMAERKCQRMYQYGNRN